MAALKILIVSQMYPSSSAPDLGIFVRNHEEVLRARGHDVSVCAVTRRGGGLKKHLGFIFRTLMEVWRQRPDAVYAHFLVPAGAIAALACLFLPRTALVVVAHGGDVRNIGVKRGVRAAMRLLTWRADRIIAVSQYLAADLAARVPSVASTLMVSDAGVDVDSRFVPADQQAARSQLGDRWLAGDAAPAFLFVGTLDERKNVRRLAAAFSELGYGTLTFVGAGAAADDLKQHERVFLVGPVEHGDVAAWMQAADVLCLPSLVEPFGQVLIEAMGCERSVLATNIGGPPEFVKPGAGILVDPTDRDAIASALRQLSSYPTPNPAAREAALNHSIEARVSVVEQELLSAVAKRRRVKRRRVKRHRD